MEFVKSFKSPQLQTANREVVKNEKSGHWSFALLIYAYVPGWGLSKPSQETYFSELRSSTDAYSVYC